jgi:hypothetical protein
LAKEKLDCKRIEIEKKKRDEGVSTLDAKTEAKFETIEDLKTTNRERLRRDKARGLKEQVKEIIIDLAVKIKYDKEKPI